MKGKRIMAVSAHPDDADFYCGGAVAKWISEGAEVIYVVCTDDSLGAEKPGVTKEELSAVRKEEQHAANRVLGVRETVWLGYPDMSLPAGEDLRLKLAREFRIHKPDIVLSFDPWQRYELHPDHTAAGRESIYARLAASNLLRYPELDAQGLTAWSVKEMYLFKTDKPDRWIDVEDFLELKVRALKCHESQFGHLVQNEQQGMYLVRELSHRHPETGRVAEGFKYIPFEGLEGLKAYIGL